MLGQETLGLLIQGRGGRDVGRDLPLALVNGRGDLRPGKLLQDREQQGEDDERPDRQVRVDRHRIRSAVVLGFGRGFFRGLLGVGFDATLRVAAATRQRHRDDDRRKRANDSH